MGINGVAISRYLLSSIWGYRFYGCFLSFTSFPVISKVQSISFYIILSLVIGCTSTKKATYFNNIKDTVITSSYTPPPPLIQSNDLLNITVSSLNPEASVVFNNANNVSQSPLSNPQGYLVNDQGEIIYPILGNLKVKGLSDDQLANLIANELVEKKLLLDPIVNVQQLNYKVTILGEVNHPMVINVKNEKISLLEAIGMAGDLTIYARRDNVLLIRELSPGKKMIRRINLNSNELFTSPYFYLVSNDVIYVEPNRSKVASTSRNEIIIPIIFNGLTLLALSLSYFKKP